MLKILNSFPVIGAIALIGWSVWGRDIPRPGGAASVIMGEPCNVVPGSVYDGDTIRVVCDREELKIRFCGIDAPEKDQPGGIEARDYLRSLLPQNGQVSVVRVERDRYGRTVAEVWNDQLTDTDQNLNAAMVLAGHAWHYEQYSGNCPNRDAIATASQIAGQPQGLPPWEWRKRN